MQATYIYNKSTKTETDTLIFNRGFDINISEDTAATLIGLFDWCGISASFCDVCNIHGCVCVFA